jgi:hypothetical protein
MKVALQVTLSAGGDSPLPSAQPAAMEFIYGIGKEGPTPFENALNGKSVGDRLTLSADTGELRLLLGHLYPDLPGASKWGHVRCRMEIAIADITQADGREVIKALASLVEGCDGGCECGCGC